MRIFFSSIIDALIKLERGFPWEWTKKNKNKQTNEETLNLWIDLENLKFSETRIIVICLPNVRKNIFMMLFYKIIQIVHALWLAIKQFYMSVCKHGFRSSFISYFIKDPISFASWFPTLISCSPNLPRVYIRLCKHRNHFTFLQS